MKRRVLFILLLSMILAVQVGTVFAADDTDAETMEQDEAIVTELDAQIESEEDVQVLSDDVVDSGYCGGGVDGKNLTWTLDSEGTLTIRGSGDMAFYSSYSTPPWSSYRKRISTVIIEDGAFNIGQYAFANCSGLTSVTIPDSVTSIHKQAFSSCHNLTSITIPNSVEIIGSYAFASCSRLTSITIPDSVTFLGSYAFQYCKSLTSVTLPNSVTSISTNLFYGCSALTSITIPDSVTSIWSYAFYGCSSLTDVTIPDSVTIIDVWVFYGCSSLTSVTIPDSVTSIEFSAFRKCSSLTSVTIPVSVTNIGGRAFLDCSSLTDVYYAGSEAEWNAIFISSENECLTSATIHYNSSGPGDYSSGTIIFENTPYSLAITDELVVSAVIANATGLSQSDITWSSSDPSIVTLVQNPALIANNVSTTATLTGISIGTATVTVSLSDGRSASCEVTVTERATLNPNQEAEEYLRQQYIDEHIEYYQSSYSTDIVSMNDTVGLKFVLDDSAEDLSDQFYKKLSDAVKLSSVSNYLNVNITDYGGVDLSVKIEPITYKNEYSALIYQLMANDAVYSEIQSTFSLNFQKNVITITKKLISEFNNLKLGDLSAEDVEVAQTKFISALGVLEEMDPESEGYQNAWMNVSDLCQTYYDDQKTLDFFETVKSDLSDVNAIISSSIQEINTIAEAYQYLCWADTYLETCEEFRLVLSDLAAEAQSRYELSLKTTYGNDRPLFADLTPTNSDAYHYKCIAEAINEWLDRMDGYEKDANSQFIKDVICGTTTNVVNLGIKCLIQLGTAHIPFLGQLNAALSLTKLGIDMITTIDDEYKDIFMVQGLSYMVSLLNDVSNEYGKELLINEVLDTSKIPIQIVPVDQETKLATALKFDESIKMYKNAILLACDYGTKYEQSRLEYAIKMSKRANVFYWYATGASTPWAEQASESSLAINLLSFQKDEISDIHCHSDGLDYDSSTGHFVYDTSTALKVVNVACPVAVTVTGPNGTQLAYLANDSTTITSGYESYFYVIPLSDDGTDYVKVAIVPDDSDYQIQIEGTDDGTMSVFIGRYEEEQVTESEVFANVEITSDTTAHLDSSEPLNTLGCLVVADAGNDSTVVYGNTFYTITLDANGGWIDAESTLTNGGGSLPTIPMPTRKSYVFAGWYTAADGGTLITTETVFDTNTTVYAQWARTTSAYRENYSVDFQVSGDYFVANLTSFGAASASPLAYLATYTADGQMDSIIRLVGDEADDTIVYTAPIPTSQYKLFILDAANGYAPMIAAYDGT